MTENLPHKQDINTETKKKDEEKTTVFENPHIQLVLFLLIAAIFCSVIYKGVIGDSSVIASVSEPKSARGLITFISRTGSIS